VYKANTMFIYMHIYLHMFMNKKKSKFKNNSEKLVKKLPRLTSVKKHNRFRKSKSRPKNIGSKLRSTVATPPSWSKGWGNVCQNIWRQMVSHCRLCRTQNGTLSDNCKANWWHDEVTKLFAHKLGFFGVICHGSPGMDRVNFIESGTKNNVWPQGLCNGMITLDEIGN
jgi:hypothetical protein